MFDSIAIGDATLDAFLWIHEAEVNCEIDKENCKLLINYADKSIVDRLEFTIGGNSCNNAVSLTRLGKNVAYFNISGQDANRDWIVRELVKEAVDTSLMQPLLGRPCNYATTIIFKGERTQLIYHDKHEYSVPPNLPVTPFMFVSSVGENFEKFFIDLANFVKNNNMKLIFNPATHQLRKPASSFEPVLRVAHILIANKEEVEHILGYPKGTQNIKVLLDSWAKFGPKFAVITDGLNGSYCFDGQKYYSMPLYEPFLKAEVERTGAGDAYGAGFMAAIMYGKGAPEAMRWGTFNGGSVVTKVGPQAGLLRLEEMEKLTRDNPDFVAKEI